MENTTANFTMPAMCRVVCTLLATGMTSINVDVPVNLDPNVNQRQPPPEPLGLPKGYVAYPDVGFAYKIPDGYYTWQEFKFHCTEDGGQLASIDSFTKLHHIQTLEPTESKRLHVGIYRMFDTGDWTSVSTGLPLSSLPWASGEPDEGRKHCAQIDFRKKGLVTVFCDHTWTGVCEIPLVQNNMANVNVDLPVAVNQKQLQPKPSGLPEGYVAYPDVGFAYKIPDRHDSWIDAKMTCMKDGGQLALIDSMTKLRHLWIQQPGRRNLNVGIFRMFDTGDWTAVSTGLPLLSLPWASGEPADGAGKHCAQIDFWKKGLVTVGCHRGGYSVCELPLVWHYTTTVDLEDSPTNDSHDVDMHL